LARLNLKKPFTKIGLVEWLKVKAQSSNPSTANKQKKKNGRRKTGGVAQEVNVPV
jgi:ribosomal protein S21